MIRIMSVLVLLFISILISCSPHYIIKSTPHIQTTSNQYFQASIKPILGPFGGYDSFYLEIINNTSKELELLWDMTMYINNGRINGGFMFKGIEFKDRNNQKSPSYIPPMSTFSEQIWPTNLVVFPSGRYFGWNRGLMNDGENGIELVIRVNGRDIKEKLLLNFSKELVRNGAMKTSPPGTKQ